MYIKAVVSSLIFLLISTLGLSESILINPPSKSVSFIVADLSGNVLAEKNSDDKLTPASVTKILTSYVALKKLGVDYKFKTNVYARSIKGKNDIAILGGGDPVFNSESLFALISQLKARGIKDVNTVYLDDSSFAEQRQSKGERAYQAGTSALSVNNNSEEVFACRLVANSAIKSCSSSYKSVNDVRRNFESIFTEVAAGLSFKFSQIKYDTIADNIVDYSLVHQHYSPPLPKILFDLNHFSTNMIAEQIVFALGENNGRFSHRDGVLKIKETIKQVCGQSFELFDGSGLSSNNKISAKQISAILRTVMVDTGIAPEFIASLSVANISGTLKKRDGFNKQIIFRGKTGMLDGVSTIGGYLTAKSGKQLIIVSLQNGVTDHDRAKSWEESIVNQLWNLY